MKHILFTCFMMVMCTLLWSWQIEGNTQNIALERAKNAVNRAAHGASLQIDDLALSNGQLIFDKTQALIAFTDILSKNMQLDSSLKALPDTLFQGQVQVVYEDYVDDSNVVARYGSGFDAGGKLYQYNSADFNLQQIINGPSVIYVIKVQKPMQIDSTEETYYYIGSIYEYPS